MNEVIESPETLAPERIVGLAAAVWRKAQILAESSSRGGQPESRALAESIAATRPDCAPSLVGLLADESPLVVAYSLMTLEMIGSDALLQLPEGLLARRNNLTIQMGSFRSSLELGSFARRIQNDAIRRSRSTQAFG